MEAYNDTKCEHNQLEARCNICMAAKAKGKKPQQRVPQSAPPSITGGPPPGIEDCTPSLRDKVDGPAPADLVPEWEKPLPSTLGIVQAGTQVHPGQIIEVDNVKDFATLPVDDSHASKVVRAAAAYAAASAKWANELANVEKIKVMLSDAQTRLSAEAAVKDAAERNLKELVNQ